MRATGALSQTASDARWAGLASRQRQTHVQTVEVRDVRPGGRLGERLFILDHPASDIPATARSKTGSMVRHPGLLEGVSFDTHTLVAGAVRQQLREALANTRGVDACSGLG